MIVEILTAGALCAAWALFVLFGSRLDPEGFRPPGRCGGCREGECRRLCEGEERA